MTPSSAPDINSHQTRSKARAACSAENGFSTLVNCFSTLERYRVRLWWTGTACCGSTQPGRRDPSQLRGHDLRAAGGLQLMLREEQHAARNLVARKRLFREVTNQLLRKHLPRVRDNASDDHFAQ